jgi:transcriptional regulator with XRE-family HTH domain
VSDLDAIRQRLRARREALGIGQRELARRMKTSQSEISHLESGSYNPTISTLDRWVGALGFCLHLSVSDPFDDTPEGAA